MTVEEAKELINKENEKRSQECSEKINEILKEFNCSLTVKGQFIGNNLQTAIEIVPNGLTN
jgi:flagellin-specific chaperone FliS